MKLPNFKTQTKNSKVTTAKIAKPPMSAAKKRQYMNAALVFSSILSVCSVAAYMINSKQTNEVAISTPKPVEQTDLTKPDQILSNEGIWKANEGTRLDSVSQQLDELVKWKAAKEQAEKNAGLNPQANSIPAFGNGASNLPPAPPTTGIKAGQGIPAGDPSIPQGSAIKSINLSGQPNIAPSKGGAEIVSDFRPNIIVNGEGGKIEYRNMAQNSESNSTGKFRAQKSYVPSGTFFRALLLGGMDAPTGGESPTASPYPVLMRVTEMAQLPNRFRENFRECFITGTGYGDLSSERAIIRPEQLSCVGSDGRAIDIAIRGYVAGEDGKTGVRGRLVTKQGAVLKNALITGLLSGIGQGFSSASGTVSTNALGTISTTPDSKQMQAALGNGVGNAFEKLASYYIKLADKMFPVIEIDAGRQVDVVLLKGFQIDGETGK